VGIPGATPNTVGLNSKGSVHVLLLTALPAHVTV
jgi:hypothetical protein